MTVTTPTEPKFQPEKYVLNKAKYSITDNKLLMMMLSWRKSMRGIPNAEPYADEAAHEKTT